MEAITLVSVFSILFSVTGAVFAYIFFVAGSFIGSLISGWMGASAVLIMLDMVSMNPAASHTVVTLLASYAWQKSIRIIGPYCERKTIKSMKNNKKEQDKLLLRILQQNKNTKYGKDHQLGEIKSREQFIKSHPITKYDHYKPYTERVRKGETNVMFPHKTVFIGLSSGTTGQSKLYPIPSHYSRSFAVPGMAIYNHYLNYTFNDLNRYIEHRLFAPLRLSEGGIPMGGVGSYLTRVPLSSLWPASVQKIRNEAPTNYVQAVFFFREKDVVFFESYSSHLMWTFCKFVDKWFDQICKDIEKGEISEFTDDIEPNVLHDINNHLSPMPDRANELREIKKQGSTGLMKRVWPKLKTLMMARGGNFAHCAKMVNDTYFKGINLITTVHGATEGFFGFNIEDNKDDDIYTFIPSTCFYEFIPEEDVDKENPTTVFLDQVVVGKIYELVITNVCGLYRNRFGDLIKIVGKNYGCPKYEFQYRAGQILNVSYERTPEKMMHDAVELTLSQWPEGVQLVNFTCTESNIIEAVTGNKSDIDNYIVFMELIKDGADYVLSAEEMTKLDENLISVHHAYAVYRDNNQVAPLEIVQVKMDSFEEVKHLMWGDYQNIQFKMPSVMRKTNVLQLLLKNRLKN